MTETPVYLDHNATTPVAREVAEAMWPFLTTEFGNPSSATPQGRRARDAVELARERLAALLGAHADEIVFTSGGTESNNLAIRGVARVATDRVAVTTSIEHPATVRPLEHLRTHHDWSVVELPVDGQARTTAEHLPPGPIGLGTFILAHNEVGTIQPIPALSRAVRSAGGVVHTDAAQAVGKLPLSVDDLEVDLLSVAGHKFYGPKGVGALYIRRGTPLAPVLVGAGQERGLRPGTENVASIVGLGMAAQLAAERLHQEHERQSALRDRLWSLLDETVAGIVRLSPTDGCLPNTLLVAVPGQLGAQILERSDDLAASTGSACHSGIHTPSTALTRMRVPAKTALGALRLTIGRDTTTQDVERAARAIRLACQGDQ